MNYYKARQKESTKRWDFTCTNDKIVWPVGYCAGFREFVALSHVGPEQNEHYRKQYDQQVVPFAEKYHVGGHETAQEAAECFKEYLLDQHMRMYPHMEGKSGFYSTCKKCGALTNGFVEVKYLSTITLCSNCQTRETVSGLIPVTGDMLIASSY